MLTAGIGKVKITPDINIKGSFRLHWDKKAKGIHDDLFAVAIFLSDTTNSIVLVSLDIPNITSMLSNAIKEDIYKKTGILPKNILISCTHTHNGPDILDEEKVCDESIKSELRRKVVECVIEAYNKSQPAKIGFGECCIPFSKNRIYTSWSDNCFAFGPVDPICDILKIEDISGKVLGIFFHYSAHPTCAMRAEFKISRDCVGVTVDKLEKKFGCISAFFQGAAGDVNFHLGERSFQHAIIKGNQMADFIIPSVSSIECRSEAVLNSDIQVLKVKTRTDYDFDIEEVIQEIDIKEKEFKNALSENRTDEEIFNIWNNLRVLKWKKLLYEENQKKPWTEVIVQSLRIGNTFIIGISGEIFVEYQLALRRYFFPCRALLFGYANGYNGYIPTKAAVSFGGYGTTPSYIQKVEPEAGEVMLSTGIKMIERME